MYFQERRVRHVFTTFSKEPFIKLDSDPDDLPAFKFNGINFKPDLVVIELESPFILGRDVVSGYLDIRILGYPSLFGYPLSGF